MKNVLFYGDSNTWGYQGDDPMHRLDADKRYTGVVAAQFPDVHFIEEGLCGRTMCSTDPIDYSRNGMAMLPALLATHDPLDVIVIMLGTNDSKAMYGHSPFTISDAMDRTIKLMQSPLLWSNTMQKPQILLVAPPKMGENLADSVYYGMFARKQCRTHPCSARTVPHAVRKIRLRLCGRLGCHGGKVLGPDSSDRRGARRARQAHCGQAARAALTPCPKAFVIFSPGFVT